jgi:hypothetical protein
MKLSPRIKALRLAIKDIQRINHEFYAHQIHAAELGFVFGIRAKKQFDERIEAIKIIQEMINEETGKR